MVYVQDINGKPLTPTTRCGWVRRAMESGKAVPVNHKPFTIRLTYPIENPVVRPMTGGIDPGRTNIGIGVIDNTGDVVYAAHVQTANQDVPKHMKERSAHRNASRTGERDARIRQAVKNDTLIDPDSKRSKKSGITDVGEFIIIPAKDTDQGDKETSQKIIEMIQQTRTATVKELNLVTDAAVIETENIILEMIVKGEDSLIKRVKIPKFKRVLLGCKKPITITGIRNTESKFTNRKRPKGWLTPTARHLVLTHLNMVDKVCGILPVTEWVLEINCFDFMRMEDGSVQGIDYRNGRLRGFKSVKDYICNEQHGHCAYCGKPIEHYHHIVPQSKGGSDRIENIIGVCSQCHAGIHTGKINLHAIGEKKKYAAISVLNQAVPYIYKGLVERFGEDHVHVCSGWETYQFRKDHGINKDHYLDALCIAGIPTNTVPKNMNTADIYEVKQFRRHDRARIHCQTERTYKLNGKTVAKNRHRRIGQDGDIPALDEYLQDLPEDEQRKTASVLTVKKSKRFYKDPNRKAMPGDLFLYNGDRYVLRGVLSRGAYYMAVGYGDKRFTASKCRLIKMGGLVYV